MQRRLETGGVQMPREGIGRANLDLILHPEGGLPNGAFALAHEFGVSRRAKIGAKR